MKKIYVLIATIIFIHQAMAQTRVSGIVKDAENGQTIIGAIVVYAEGKGTVTEIDGSFDLQLMPGTYNLEISFIGYKTDKQTLEVGNEDIDLVVLLEVEKMQEVEIIGDLVIDRKTPVAYSNISPLRIKEELGTQDITMVLNTTPGIHATQSGGGDGDSRVNIRGFENRNQAVMIDGIPMNDMENGSVYWGNWLGLELVTRSMQVQRGLGASKLAVPSLGGTINILTEGIDSKKQVDITTSYGNNNNARISVALNSGILPRGWGIAAVLSARRNDGWVENLGSRQLFYFLKLQKQFEKTTYTFTTMGSPQTHNQRIGRQQIGYYDVNYALAQGIDTSQNASNNYGLRHNEHWGYITRNRFDEDAKQEVLSSRTNYYFKPIFNLKQLWTPNEKFGLSNALYASLGRGGGTSGTSFAKDETGQIDYNQQYYDNTHGSSFFGIYTPQWDTTLVNDTTKYKAENYLLSRVNNHFWLGLLSTAKYKVNNQLELSGGIDARYYQTNRYSIIWDLLGADYAVPAGIGGGNANSNDNGVRYVGDKFGYDIRSYVKQSGVFGLAEYSEKLWSAFLNVTASVSSYNRVDYYARKNEDGTFQSSGWLTFPAGSIKTGFNLNINEQQSIFINTGYISRAPMLNNVYASSTLRTYSNLQNEIIAAGEAGYLYKHKDFRMSLNAYLMSWDNKPVLGTRVAAGEVYYFSVPGMKAAHKGIELEGEWKIEKMLTIEGAFSLGDWRWISNGTAIITDESGTLVLDTIQFAAKDVLVGNSAQIQSSLGFRFTPIKGLYIKPRLSYFDKYYAQFDPETLGGENANRQSWRIPSYYQIDLSMGYSFRLARNGNKLSFKLNLLNLTNAVFITDAYNNEFGIGFDAASAGVYMGMGFRWNVGASYTF